jgi:hypothetical protein
MDEGGFDSLLSFIERGLASAFAVRQIALAPGQQRNYVEEDWSDALVVIERGAVELVFLGGARLVFVRGDVLCLDGLPLRGLRNHREVPALLSAVSRSASSGIASRPVVGDRSLFPSAGSKQMTTHKPSEELMEDP